MFDPSLALQQMFKQNALKMNLFPPSSRYHGIDTTTLETSDGRTITYVRRRFVPQPERFDLLQEHTVIDGERLDQIAASYLGDPEQFWRICDANGAMEPVELTAIAGKRLRITLPEGIPGTPNA